MKIISININNGCTGKTNHKAFEQWIDHEQPDLLLCQESCGYKKNDVKKYKQCCAIRGYSLLKGTDGSLSGDASRIACYGREGSSYASFPVEKRSCLWQEIRLNGIAVHNVYFPSDNTRQDVEARRAFLKSLVVAINPHDANIVIGDFNMAPRREDAPPCAKKQYSGPDIWDAFTEFCAYTSLCDITLPGRPACSIARTGYRCDLAFASLSIREADAIQAWYDHRTDRNRLPTMSHSEGFCPFTDHSAIILEIDFHKLSDHHAGLRR